MTAEQRFSDDLDIRHYACRWREAKRMTHRARPELDDTPYWLAVRLCFLELGGYYKSQVDEQGRPYWNHHPA